ncbi:hypothetical protein, partial [Thiolapillus sp.]|uniref:hypothetical protein n=1 Tax=Thiolapillus sp. TaxID=2017437 RepID=UPI003AF56B0F
MRTTGKQCGLAATGVYQPSLRSPWLAAAACPELAQPRQAQLFFQQQDVFAQFGVEGLLLRQKTVF